MHKDEQSLLVSLFHALVGIFVLLVLLGVAVVGARLLYEYVLWLWSLPT